jgi:mRNA-degrading endonuclease RelE of RelBE toxin-antitoxin system
MNNAQCSIVAAKEKLDAVVIRLTLLQSSQQRLAEIKKWAIIEEMYEMDFTQSARQDLKVLRKFAQQLILDGIDEQLPFEPLVETLNRKQLEPNDISEWELRLGKYRVLYDVEEQGQRVVIRAIGYKVGNDVYIRGERREL